MKRQRWLARRVPPHRISLPSKRTDKSRSAAKCLVATLAGSIDLRSDAETLGARSAPRGYVDRSDSADSHRNDVFGQHGAKLLQIRSSINGRRKQFEVNRAGGVGGK